MNAPDYSPAPPADFVLAFDLPQAHLRGRFVRLDQSSAHALRAHALAEPAARIAAETCVLAILLGSSLKLNGRLTVQTKTDGPLDLVTADYFGPGEGKNVGVRGYARLDESRFAALLPAPDFAAMMGEGVMAITIDPERSGQTYQGIVPLEQDGMGQSAETYFSQSEQLPTAIRLAAAPLFRKGDQAPHWRAGGILLQATPDAAVEADDWERLSLFLATLEDFELVDVELSAEALLWRLFHEDEVRVHQAQSVEFRCSCETSRIASVLKAYRPDDREGLADSDGVIRAKCEFCARVHEIAAAELATAD